MENPLDEMAWLRVFQLIKGIGPSTATVAFQHIVTNGGKPSALSTFKTPASAREDVAKLVVLIADLENIG